MFVPGTNPWAAIGAATTATSDITTGAESLSEAATPKVGVTPEATQATGATLETAALETGATLETTTLATGATPETTTP